MRRLGSALFLGFAAAGAAVWGCATEDTLMPPGPAAFPDLFYEPPAFCLAGPDDADSLAVYNFGDTVLVWTPVHVPPGSEGLDAPGSIPPGTGVLYSWSWSPEGPYPRADSIVAETNDRERPRVVIPVEAREPGDPDRVTPLPAPFPLAPEDGAVFRFEDVHEDGFLLEWSRIDDCSAVLYKLEIDNTNSRFRNVVCCDLDRENPILAPLVTVYPDSADTVTAYWRVIAFKTGEDGLTPRVRGLAGEVRTWTVLPPDRSGPAASPDRRR